MVSLFTSDSLNNCICTYVHVSIFHFRKCVGFANEIWKSGIVLIVAHQQKKCTGQDT